MDEAPILRKAKAFYAVADGISIQIADDELIVGNVSSKPRVAYFAPETFYWGWYKPGREQVLSSRLLYGHDIRFQIPEEIAEFWLKMARGDTSGHFVPDYARVLKQGFAGLQADAQRHRARHREQGTLDDQRAAFYDATEIACQAAIRFAQRHAQAARKLAADETDATRRAELQQIAESCEQIAKGPPRSFREALQAFWFTHVLIHVNSSEWSISPGRFDQYIWPFYQRDLATNRLTREGAAELLGCLWVKFNQVRVCAADMINYQNLMIGGADQQGRDMTNDLSYLCIEVTEKLRGVTQPGLSMRWHSDTPQELLLAASRLILTGSGRPAMFNDDTIIPALEYAGVDPSDSWDYSIAGCEEPAIAGQLYGVCRYGQTNTADCLLKALKHNPETFDDLLKEYQRELSIAMQRTIEWGRKRDERNAKSTPHPYVSLLFDDCLRDGRDIAHGGARYDISSISEAGTIGTANALFAVKEAVYEQKRISIRELNQVLGKNFEGEQALQSWLINQVPKFGNDNDEIDLFARKVVRMNRRAVEELGVRDYRDGVIVVGSGKWTAWAAGHRSGATPDGRFSSHGLSVSLGRVSGTERLGPTAVLNSVAKLDGGEQAGGALTHIQLPYSSQQTGKEATKVAALIGGFFQQGGMGVHFSVVDVDRMRQAMKEPEKHLNLLVRMGGYSAPFVMLTPELQRDILNRMEHQLR